jgi:hypothetical protein
MKTIFKFIVITCMTATFISCKKDKDSEPTPTSPTTPSTSTGNLKIAFEAMVGDSSLQLGTANTTYTNQSGNTFNVSVYKYYISNIKIIKSDNSVWIEPNSYHLIDHADLATTTFTLSKVPVGTYKGIEFMIGVDSTKNAGGSGAQTGALDAANGMYWVWNSGYIMAKFEGTSPQSGAIGQNLKFHIGGFSGANKTMRVVSPSFGIATANVSSAVTPEIQLTSDLLEWFKTPDLIDFSATHTVHMPGASAKKIADNYADMYTVEHIHNN